MILHGDCLEKLKELADNSIDSVVTDPPAGISFLSKGWDSDKGGRDQWIKWLSEIMVEVKRVLKPGGHAFVWALPRTSHWTATAIEDAGFQVRDIAMHIFGSGFPKSHNLKGEHVGFGTALKPAAEHWILARKPLEKGLTVAENVQKWGTGALNIDASRIDAGAVIPGGGKFKRGESRGMVYGEGEAPSNAQPHTQGRWPANVILDEEAAEMLDEQSGSRGGGGGSPKSASQVGFSGAKAEADKVVRNDTGGASRFFYCAKASKAERNAGLEGMPLRKRSDANKMMGDAGPMKTGSGNERTTEFLNHHPTVKPIKLMEYLIRLVTPPNGTVLDCFAGSGTTGVAAKRLGFGFIGVEREAEYVAIAEKRMEAVG